MQSEHLIIIIESTCPIADLERMQCVINEIETPVVMPSFDINEVRLSIVEPPDIEPLCGIEERIHDEYIGFLDAIVRWCVVRGELVECVAWFKNLLTGLKGPVSIMETIKLKRFYPVGFT